MKISELLIQLKEVQELKGDLDVFFIDAAGGEEIEAAGLLYDDESATIADYETMEAVGDSADSESDEEVETELASDAAEESQK